MAIIVRQTLPLSISNLHFGIIFITLKASLSSNGSTEVLTLILATLPSLFTIKDTTTVPESYSSGSYRVLHVLGKPLHEADQPPGNCGTGQFDRSLSSRILNGSFRNCFLYLSSIHYTQPSPITSLLVVELICAF